MSEPVTVASAPANIKWAKVIDHEKCIGCHACTTACKSENEVPVSVTRTYVKYVEVGEFPQVRRAFQVTRCNQCEWAPCVTACPTSAMYKREDGIVDFDKSICIGCKACIAACPYDAIFINPDDHSAEKCNFCAHRIDVGLEPACVVVCPTQAILVGDLNDSSSLVSQIVHRDVVAVRRPEKETRPKLFYRGAHQATLDPLAARRPDGGLFLWSQQLSGGKYVVSGHTQPANSSASALLAYDVPHSAPWDWRVSLYTLTKGIATGVYLVALLLLWRGDLAMTTTMWHWTVPILGIVFLTVTGGLLVWDLDHPERFYLIFLRPQWKSWLVRGGFLLGAYGGVLALHAAAVALGHPEWASKLIPAGIPLAIGTAVYTAYLFAQAKARDLWQSPLLPPQLVVQSLLAGAATLAPFASGGTRHTVLVVLAMAAAVHLLLVLGETTMTHVTAHAHLASYEMTRGRFRNWFRVGVALMAIGVAAPWLGVWVGPLVLVGLFAYEHAFVQAGQAVPLA
jgi:Fe-S-cluster-containing dehydrogenase component/formate-dependent nitrite reductase membrane component NrfD